MVKVEDVAAAILKLGNVHSLRYDESTHQEMIIVTDRQNTPLQDFDTEIGQSWVLENRNLLGRSLGLRCSS